MARRPRLELAGAPLHVIQRGNNRAACFNGDADRRMYLGCLEQAATRHGCAVHAYVLMPNHVHLLVTPETAGGVAAMMQDVGRRYVRLFNETYGRTGTLWEGRYKSSLIDSETYLLTCHRYIELNPVRALLVDSPIRYPWSSHAHYRLGTRNSLLTRHPVFNALADDEPGRREAFAALFCEPLGDETVKRIRDSANKGRALGSDSFLDRIGEALGRSARPPKRGRPFKQAAKSAPFAAEQEMLI